MLKHPHIVRFDDCFEDEENVYMVLELCDHGVSWNTRPEVLEADDWLCLEHAGPAETPETVYRTRSTLLHDPNHRRVPVHAPNKRHSPRPQAGESVLGRGYERQSRGLWPCCIDREARR